MCKSCDFERIETTTFLQAFAYDEKSMDYHDGPLAGWMSCKACARWFAFDCNAIIETMLWHWSMIPSDKTDDARQAIRDSASKPDGWWLSVVEDRRGGVEQQRAVRIQNSQAKPSA
jgi:hypothetical protein